MLSDGPVIAVLGGSLRDGSRSRVVLRAATGIIETNGAHALPLDVRDLDLPMYNSDVELDQYGPDAAKRIRRLLESCRSADAMIWCSPAYHGSVSGVFKNALDMMELLADDQPAYLTGKAVGIITISDSPPLGTMARSIHELRAWTAPTQPTFTRDHFTADLQLAEGGPVRRLTRLVRELIWFANARRSHG